MSDGNPDPMTKFTSGYIRATPIPEVRMLSIRSVSNGWIVDAQPYRGDHVDNHRQMVFTDGDVLAGFVREWAGDQLPTTPPGSK